ncbi:MAG: hypothetical protein JWL86_6267 [Rhizobium sp.]|nr:hypothetical protein [Rhizobium sp.]
MGHGTRRNEHKAERYDREKRLKLEPNAETIEAIEAARRGEMTNVDSVEHLFASLNADDSE